MIALRRAALTAFCVHAVAGAAMALVLRRGLDTNPDLRDRFDFLVNHRTLWTAGWLTWTAAAIAILYFYVTFAAAHRNDKNTLALRLGVLLTAAAIAPDLSAQAIEVGLLPDLAQRADVDHFILLNRAATLLSGLAANGLYSLSALILAWTTRGAYPRWVVSAGLVVALSGFWLSAAALIHSVDGMFWSNVVLVPGILIWLFGVANFPPPDYDSGKSQIRN